MSFCEYISDHIFVFNIVLYSTVICQESMMMMISYSLVPPPQKKRKKKKEKNNNNKKPNKGGRLSGSTVLSYYTYMVSLWLFYDCWLINLITCNQQALIFAWSCRQTWVRVPISTTAQARAG